MRKCKKEPTLYEILRVSKNATLAEIKSAYRQRCMEYHPDINPKANNDICHEMMCKINEAYRILRDAEQRRIYDEKLKDQLVVNQNSDSQEKAPDPKDKDSASTYENEDPYKYYNSIDFDEDMQEEFIFWMQTYMDTYLKYVVIYYKYNTSKDFFLYDLLEKLFESNIMTEKESLKKEKKKKVKLKF